MGDHVDDTGTGGGGCDLPGGPPDVPGWRGCTHAVWRGGAPGTVLCSRRAGFGDQVADGEGHFQVFSGCRYFFEYTDSDSKRYYTIFRSDLRWKF